MRPGCYDPSSALEDMDEAGILASLNFPSIPRFCGQLFWEAKDKELALLCVQAYNDWMIDEWCAAAPGRFIPLMHHPAVGPAAGRRRRSSACAAKGVARVLLLGEPRAARAARPSTTPAATGTR